MADHTESDDRSRRVASGFPDPADVPGPTERLRELHGETATEPKPPKYGRASASTAGSGDYVSLDDMERGSAADAPAERVAGFAQRVAEETATRLRADFDRRGIAGKAKAAGVGVGEIGVAGALGLGVLGATGTAMIAGLSRVMPVWAAALVTAGAFGVPAAILSSRGVKRINAGIGLREPATAS
ncbi:MAG TPA: phage holin family protein [Candidatus Dormibacteraeota bacterium]